MMRSFLAALLGVGLVGCGIDASGIASGDAGVDAPASPASSHDAIVPTDAVRGSMDSGHVSMDSGHSSTEAAATTDAPLSRDAVEEPPPAPCTVPPGTCVGTLPATWQLAFLGTSSAACPSEYVSSAVVSNPVAATGACGCSCTVTTPPTCDQGSLYRMIADSPPCQSPGATLDVNGPGCTAAPGGGGALVNFGESTPLAMTTGSCTASSVATLANVTTTAGNVCTPPSTCEEQACSSAAPPGLARCISIAGVQGSCPGGWGSPTVVGDSPSLSCSACTCDVNTQSTCTNTSLEYFSDPSCASSVVTLPINGTCAADPEAGQTGVAFKYHSTLNQVCATDGPKTPLVSLTNPRTICCKP